jgi:repressor of nif and glnA expression
MTMDDNPIISVLARQAPLKAESIATELGEQVEEHSVEEKLLDMQERELVEPAEAMPNAWQLTNRGIATAKSSGLL